jgi:CBS domain-containing protein
MADVNMLPGGRQREADRERPIWMSGNYRLGEVLTGCSQRLTMAREARMKIGDVMTPDLEVVTPSETLKTAARLMAEIDSGSVPVGEDNKLVGIITSRDIAVQVVAAGKDPEQITVRQVMSPDVLYCFADERVEDVSEKMGDWWVRRLPVVNEDKRLLGTVSLSDLAPSTTASEETDAQLAAE